MNQDTKFKTRGFLASSTRLTDQFRSGKGVVFPYNVSYQIVFRLMFLWLMMFAGCLLLNACQVCH